MTETKKFMFDTHDFNRLKPDSATYSEEQMALAKTQSHALGKSDGLKEARQQQEERIAEILQKTLALAGKMIEAEDRREVEKSVQQNSPSR